MALGAAGQHAERVVELDAEVSTLRDHLAEVNRLLSLNVAEVARLQASEPGMKRRVLLTCKQLREAADFGDPDHDQGDTEIMVEHWENGINGPGLYAWYADYPDEGCYPLFDLPPDAEQPETKGASDGA